MHADNRLCKTTMMVIMMIIMMGIMMVMGLIDDCADR